MLRKNEQELLEQPGVPDHLATRAYRDMAMLHRWLGDTRFVVHSIRRDRLPVRRVLDVGCGTGIVSEQVKQSLGVTVIGVDINPRPSIAATIPILRADAVRDPLPPADVAYSMHVGHHLCDSDLVTLIRNVGRFCRRFILVDLVRHRLPLALFRLCIAPLVCPLDAEDGQRSLRRAYTPQELRRLTAYALDGTSSTFRSVVSPFCVRQAIDIAYSPAAAASARGER